MVQFLFKCETCKSSWKAFSAKESETRQCRHCGNTIFGEKILPVPPAPPLTSGDVSKAVPPKPRRWEAAPQPEKAKEEVKEQEEKKPQEKKPDWNSSGKTLAAVAIAEKFKAAAEESAAKAEEAKVVESPKKREYVPASERPENQRPKPKFFRFFALGSPGGPGIAGAIAETRLEAIERIVVRFLENLAIHSNRNHNITTVTMKFPLLMQSKTPQEFLATLRRYGLNEEQYQQMIGPTPMDSLGGWNAHLQSNTFAVGQTGYLLAEQLKQELVHASFIEYPLENCAFYMGGPLSFSQIN